VRVRHLKGKGILRHATVKQLIIDDLQYRVLR
jgi:hypothetical protein